LQLTPLQLGVLLGAALVAGVVDAIAGGGGLISVPALLWAGLPPHLALGTNKGQGVFGPISALIRFRRAGLVDERRARISFPLGFLGSLAGAALVLRLPPAVLRPVVLVLLVLVALVLAVRRAPVEAVQQKQRTPLQAGLIAAAIALLIGCYDGFFGPGTGTFLIVSYALLFAAPLARASADAKVVNFASNLAAVITFASSGAVLWRVALPMAAAQAVGGFVGAHLAVRGGDRRVRWVVLLVVAALVTKLGLDSIAALAVK
jgi:uncharacterized membrane protein YfcA